MIITICIDMFNHEEARPIMPLYVVYSTPGPGTNKKCIRYKQKCSRYKQKMYLVQTKNVPGTNKKCTRPAAPVQTKKCIQVQTRNVRGNVQRKIVPGTNKKCTRYKQKMYPARYREKMYVVCILYRGRRDSSLKKRQSIVVV
jgi:hypothetical protein